MIRFVEITGLYLDDTKSFGFYDTVKDEFISVGGLYVFDSVSEFKEVHGENVSTERERLYSIIPKHWKNFSLIDSN